MRCLLSECGISLEGNELAHVWYKCSLINFLTPYYLECEELTVGAITNRVRGCNCIRPCVDESTCSCMRRSLGRNYNRSHRLLKVIGEQDQYQRPVFECHSECGCQFLGCRNRNVQYRLGDTSLLSVFDTRGMGRGVCATRNIRRGEFVCVYQGRYMNPANVHTIAERQLRTSVDGAQPSITDSSRWPPSAFINHSCQPNMTVIPVRIESSKAYLTLFAIRDIREGEELTYDYTESSSGVIWDNKSELSPSPFKMKLAFKTTRNVNLCLLFKDCQKW
ncbi:unnamed protein product [Mesocestoides corti]|uniref:SET domain-containing protein n=1 Tax=Mesocestoides corti TaxID=53468 RepID=A0A3P6H371_MESCO|nr:unnamed protein product [Mesocestoides corti]